MCKRCYQRVYDQSPRRKAYYAARRKGGGYAAHLADVAGQLDRRRAELLVILRLFPRTGMVEEGWVPSGWLRRLSGEWCRGGETLAKDLRWLVRVGLVDREERGRGRFWFRAAPTSWFAGSTSADGQGLGSSVRSREEGACLRSTPTA